MKVTKLIVAQNAHAHFKCECLSWSRSPGNTPQPHFGSESRVWSYWLIGEENKQNLK